jgi:predicted DNA-binding transcriptional regulator AlpA
MEEAGVSRKKFFSPAQFRELTGLSLATIHRRLADGSLPKVQIGGKRCRILIPRSALSAVIQSATEPSVCDKSTAPSTAEKPPALGGMRPRWMSRLPPT